MRPRASKSTVSCGFADTPDVSDDMTVATVLPRRTARCASGGSEDDSLVVEDGDDLELAAESVDVVCDGGEPGVGSAL